MELDNSISNVYDNLALNTGLGADQLKFLTCSVAAYPLAFLLSSMPNVPLYKHLFGMTFGLIFGWINMGPQLLHLFFSSTVAYIIMHVFSPKRSAQLIYLWCMLYLSGSHIYRMMTDYMGYTLDFTGPQMLLTLKLVTMGLDYYDGTKTPEELGHYAKLMNFKRIPNLVEFYGYVFFFPGLLAGPAFNLREYLEYIDGSLFKDAPGKRMPSPFAALGKNTVVVLLVAVGLVINMKYSLYYARSNEFYEHDFIYRILYVWMAGTLSRFPYYFAWKLSEGACILAGIGYNKSENGVPRWDRATNCKILTVELAQNFREVTEGWNIRTDKWLKHYIYERVDVMPLALTFFNSALWHGFYPGYYFSFITASGIVQVARFIRRSIRAWFVEADGKTPKQTKPIYDIVCTLVTAFTLNYTMAPFVLLGFEYSVRLWSSLYFIGHVGTFIMYILSVFVIRPPKIPKKTQ